MRAPLTPATRQGCRYEEVNCDDGVACTTDVCNPASGCVNTPDDRPCDDNDACTIDGCDPVMGCRHTVLDCDDAVACTVDACGPASGAPTPDDRLCDDTNACTLTDATRRWDAGMKRWTATTMTPATDTCDSALDACMKPWTVMTASLHFDSCDPLEGCYHTPDDRLCDDGDSCTTDACIDGLCSNIPGMRGWRLLYD